MTRLKLTLLSVTTLVTAFCGQLIAANRYVATNGNDTTGTGTTAKPYFSLNKAASVANAGDIIYLTPGTYNYTGAQYISRSGTSTAPIKVRVRPDSNTATQRQVIFNMAGAGNYQSGIEIYGAYIDIDASVTGAPASKKYLVIKNVAGNGINLRGYDGGAANNVTIRQVEINTCQYSSILVSKRGGSSANGNYWRPWTVRISDCEIHHNVLHNSSRSISGGWPPVSPV
jgi:hypothetical protein